MSQISRENSEMSSEADISFMENACVRIARAKGVHSRQEQVSAMMRALQVSANRAYEFLTGKARRVDGFEKDRAREIIARIEAEDAQARHADHLQWLKAEIERHRATGQGIRGPHVDGLEHFLRMAGGDNSALARLDEETRASRTQGE